MARTKEEEEEAEKD